MIIQKVKMANKQQINLLLIIFSLTFPLSCTSSSTRSLIAAYAATAKLVLNQDLTIPANTTGVFIQGGAVVSASERDQYHPNCRLIVRDLKSSPQVVHADQFDITRMMFNEDYVSKSHPVYAAAGSKLLLAEGSPSPQDYATIFYLASAKQPNVTELVCAHWEDPTLANHLTPEQIHTTLGDIMTLK